MISSNTISILVVLDLSKITKPLQAKGFDQVHNWDQQPSLIKLYELVCKVEDDLRVMSDKIRKRKTSEVNEERVIG